MIRKALLVLLSLALCFESQGRKKSAVAADTTEITDAFLDTVQIFKPKEINDYSLIGINGGVSLCGMYFNPTKHGNLMKPEPGYFSIMYTHYEKMFQYIPYFGFQIGFSTSTEGYEFKNNEYGKPVSHIDYATKCRMRTIEMPAMAQIHIDASAFKMMINAGGYLGYRMSISRSGVNGFDTNYSDKFHDYEHRMDYGLMGGVGFALMFDPVEIHINGLVRWSWSNMNDPDYYSHYYHRYVYPLDVLISAGIHYQLTKRKGKTSSALRREAYDKVYGKTEDNTGEGGR